MAEGMGTGEHPARVCAECGATAPPGFRFCGVCGHRVDAVGPEEAPLDGPPPAPRVSRDRPSGDLVSRDGPRPPSRRRRLVAAIVAILAIVAGTVVVSRLGPGPRAPLEAAGRGDAGRSGAFAALPPDALPDEVAWRDTWTAAGPDRQLTPRRPVAVGPGYLLPTTGGLALLDRADGHVRWRAELDVSGTADPLPVDDRLVAVAGNDEVSLIDAVDGTRLWRTRVPELGTPRDLAATSRTLAVTGDNGTIVLLDLARGSRRAELPGRALLGGRGPFSADAVVAAEDLLVAVVRRASEDVGRLVALTPDGEVAWVSETTVSPHLPLLAGQGVVVATNAREGIVGVWLADGVVRWRWRLAADERPGDVAAVATSADGVLALVASASGVRRTLGTASGLLLVSENGAPLPVTGTGPADAAGRVAAVTPDGRIEVVEVMSGRVVGTGPTTGSRLAVPIVDGAHLVTALAGGQVVAEPTAPEGSSWASSVTPLAACTAVGAGDAVLVSDGDEVRAHDTLTGVRRWVAHPEGGTTGELTAGAGVVVSVSPAGLITALDGVDGTARWVASAGGQPLGSAVVVDDNVVVGGGHTVGLAGDTRAGYLRALDVEDGARRWFVNTVGPLAHPPSVAEGRVIVATATADVEAVDLASGVERWRVELAAPAVSPPALRGEAVVVVDELGTLTTLGEDEGGARPLATTTFDLPLRRAPVVTEDTIVVRADSQRLVALDLETHRVRWEAVVTGDVLTTPPTVVGDLVVVGGQRGLHTFRLRGGAVAGRAEVGPLVGTVTGTTHGVVACRADGVVLALR